jgi:hypothetical protein
MKAIARKDLVVGVEYTLDYSGGNKAHYVGREESTDTLFFMASEETPYFVDKEGFIIFDTSGDPFFLEETI